MEELEKSFFVNELFDIYGSLLSSRQQRMIDLYYRMDLSLSEIASQENISRNGVYDALKKGIASLEDYENQLNVLKNRKRRERKISLLEQEMAPDVYRKIVAILKEEE